jgi:hypothetical protein
MSITSVFLTWALFSAIPQAQAADMLTRTSQSPPLVKVKVAVSAPAEIKDQIQQYIEVQLRSLGDVQVVEAAPDWTLQIVTTQLTDANGTLQALGLSFLIEQHGPHMEMLQALAQACRYFVATGRIQDPSLEDHMKRLIMGTEALPKADDLVTVRKHKMSVILPDKLPQACYDIVSALEAERFGTTQKSGPVGQAAPQTSSSKAGQAGRATFPPEAG